MEGDVARARAGTHDSRAARYVAQRFAVNVEVVDEHAVGAQVCGEHEAVGGIGKDAVGMGRGLTLGSRPFSRVLNHLRGWVEGAIRPDREQRDTSSAVVGYEHHAPAAVHAHVARRTTLRRLLVQSGERTAIPGDREGAHRALLELVHGVEHASVRVDREEGRVRAGGHRADSPQCPGAPVHADEVDALGAGAFGICPNVEKITIRGTLRATREPDETNRRRGQEVAARQVAGVGHRGARTSFPGATPSTARPFATTDTPFTITWSTPTGESDGSRYVERSITVAGSKTVISASAPTRRRPFCRIAGTRASSRCAGRSVILRMASISESEWPSRT